MPVRYTEVKFAADGVTSTTNTYALTWDEVRNERDMALSHTDKYTLADRWASLTTQQQADITTFRAALRSVPQDYADAEDVVFPLLPGWLNEPIGDSLFTGK